MAYPIGSLQKVFLPISVPDFDPEETGLPAALKDCEGETPWAEVVATYDDGTWDGRIDNQLIFAGLHGIKTHDVIRFELIDDRWVPVDRRH